MMLEEGYASHTLLQSRALTSGGSDLSCSVGWYSMSAFGHRARRQGGQLVQLRRRQRTRPRGPARHRVLRHRRDAARHRAADPHPADRRKFVGDVVLTPPAVSDLLDWLLGQIGDVQLIAGSSLYRDKVGSADRVAAADAEEPLRRARRRCAVSRRVRHAAGRDSACRLADDADAQPLRQPQDFGLPHVPVAAVAGSWRQAIRLARRCSASVQRGALVGRLSMGNPASNGDFSGVIKNSFLIDGGVVGTALSEVMISGNMAQMLRDVDCGQPRAARHRRPAAAMAARRRTALLLTAVRGGHGAPT